MIQRFADWLVYGVFGMSAGTHAGNAVDFFVYDSVKILLLLFLISIVMGIVNAYFPIDELRRCLAARKLYGFQYLFASLFGAVNRSAPARRFRCSSGSSRAAFRWG